MRAVNLIPAEQRAGGSVGAGRSQGAVYAVLVLVAGLALLAFLYGRARHDIGSRRQQAAAATAKAQQLEAEAARLAPYASFVTLRQQRTQAVDAVVESRFDWAHLFHELGRVLPTGVVSVDSLAGQVGSTTTTSSASSATNTATSGGSATPAGSTPSFTLEGCAITQSAVALTLERLRLIDGVSEVTLESSTEASAGGAGSGAGTGGCPGHDPAFTVEMTFDPLPSEASITTATRTVSDAPDGGATQAKSGAASK